MIIVSQDKTKTTESLELTIGANTVEKGDFPTTTIEIIGYYILDRKNGIVLGEYKTEERAKEVLQEIIEFYEISKRHERSSNNGITLFLKDTFVYQMPKD